MPIGIMNNRCLNHKTTPKKIATLNKENVGLTIRELIEQSKLEVVMSDENFMDLLKNFSDDEDYEN